MAARYDAYMERERARMVSAQRAGSRRFGIGSAWHLWTLVVFLASNYAVSLYARGYDAYFTGLLRLAYLTLLVLPLLVLVVGIWNHSRRKAVITFHNLLIPLVLIVFWGGLFGSELSQDLLTLEKSRAGSLFNQSPGTLRQRISSVTSHLPKSQPDLDVQYQKHVNIMLSNIRNARDLETTEQGISSLLKLMDLPLGSNSFKQPIVEELGELSIAIAKLAEIQTQLHSAILQDDHGAIKQTLQTVRHMSPDFSRWSNVSRTLNQLESDYTFYLALARASGI